MNIYFLFPEDDTNNIIKNTINNFILYLKKHAAHNIKFVYYLGSVYPDELNDFLNTVDNMKYAGSSGLQQYFGDVHQETNYLVILAKLNKLEELYSLLNSENNNFDINMTDTKGNTNTIIHTLCKYVPIAKIYIPDGINRITPEKRKSIAKYLKYDDDLILRYKIVNLLIAKGANLLINKDIKDIVLKYRPLGIINLIIRNYEKQKRILHQHNKHSSITFLIS
jgi:hypothetical protein